MVRTRRLVAIAAVIAMGSCSRDCPPQPLPQPPPAVAANPVQHEMQLLLAAIQATLSGIVYGDVRAVPAAFEEVDRAKEATEAALESGRYVPARNADRLADFRALDEAFHADLEKIVAAATRNDVPATAEAFGAVMRGCPTCHAEFRK